MKVNYTCPKCGTTGHSEVYRIGRGKDDGLHTCIACWSEWAEPYRRRIKMESFYANLIRWNLPSSKREHAEELAHYVGHELGDKELTGEELEGELKASYHELKELHAESNITIDEWVQWVKEGIKEYQSWLEER